MTVSLLRRPRPRPVAARALDGGCAPAHGLWTWLSGQRHFEVRDPSQLPHAPIPPIPPPQTVSSPPSPRPQGTLLDEPSRIALENSQVVRVLAGPRRCPADRRLRPGDLEHLLDEARAVFGPQPQCAERLHRTEQPSPSSIRPARSAPSFTGRASIPTTSIWDCQNAMWLGGTLSLDIADSRDALSSGVFPLNPEERSSPR